MRTVRQATFFAFVLLYIATRGAGAFSVDGLMKK